MTLPSGELPADVLTAGPFESLAPPAALMSIRQRLARGIGWSALAAAGSRSIALVCSVGLARLLGRERFGELGVVQSTIATFQVFAAFGLGLTASKYVAGLRHSDPQRAGRIAALSGAASAFTGAVVAVAMIVAAPWLATHTLGAPRMAGLLRIGALALFLTSVNSAQLGTATGLEDFRSVAKLNLIGAALSFPLSMAGAWFKGIEGAMWGQAIGLLGTCIASYIEIRVAARRSSIVISCRGWTRELRVLFGFSLPAVLGGLCVTPVNWICMAMLAHHAEGFNQLGLYNAANQWRTAILFLPGLLSSVAMPILSNLYGQGDTKQFLKVLRYNLLLTVCATAIVGGAVVIASPLIMSGYGREFSSAIYVLLPLAISAVFIGGLGIVGDAIASSGRMWDGLMLNLIWATAMLITAREFIPAHGAIGLAWATVVSYCIHFTTVSVYVRIRIGRNTQQNHGAIE